MKNDEPKICKPRFLSALQLKCPYCGQQNLLVAKSYFTFNRACHTCRYLIEREAGYWSGASWMINLPISSTLAFVLAVLLALKSDMNEEYLAMIVSIFVLVFGMIIFPFCQSIYMWIDHKIKPLSEEDFQDYERYLKKTKELDNGTKRRE